MGFNKKHKINLGRKMSSIIKLKISRSNLKEKIKKFCLNCNKSFLVIPCRIEAKYCTKICVNKSKVGKSTWNKGLIGFRKGEKHPWRSIQREENSPTWKGDKVGYRGLHIWVQNHLGKAKKCNFCGLDEIPKNKKRYFQWANISKNYRRELNDWIELCVRCHKNYDKNLI